MQPFHSDANLGHCGGTRVKIEPLDDGNVKVPWMPPPPPIISFDQVLRQGGGFNTATNDPEWMATSCELTETSGPPWSIDGTF